LQGDERCGQGWWNKEEPQQRVGRDRRLGADSARRLQPEHGRKRAGDGEVWTNVEAEQERRRVGGWCGGEQVGSGQVVQEERCERAGPRRRPDSVRVEQVRGAVPEASERAEGDREREQERERTHVNAWPKAAQSGGGEADREHR